MRVGTVNIVGIKYTVYLYNNFEKINNKAIERDKRYNLVKENEDRKPLDGYCDYSAKELNIFCDDYTDREYFENTLRHEITHAFLYEIAYQHHYDEELVDKIAKWSPQICELSHYVINRIREAADERHRSSV